MFIISAVGSIKSTKSYNKVLLTKNVPSICKDRSFSILFPSFLEIFMFEFSVVYALFTKL